MQHMDLFNSCKLQTEVIHGHKWPNNKFTEKMLPADSVVGVREDVITVLVASWLSEDSSA